MGMMAERYSRGRWDLSDLIPARSGEGMEEVFDRLEGALIALEARCDDLSEGISAGPFREILNLVERTSYIARQLNGYAILWFSEDTSDQDALAFRERVERTLADARNRTLFFELWWKGLNGDVASRLLQASGGLRYYLESLRRFAPYTLSESEERVINVKNVTGVEGMVTLYEMITNRFTFELELDGEVKTLTRSELMAYVRDPSPDRREAAYRALFDVFSKEGGLLGQIYKYVVSDWFRENVELRGISSPMAVRNLRNDIPDDVVEILLESCRKNASLYQRFFRLKAKLLGLDRLRRYDIYAPLQEARKEYPFEEGADLVFSSLKRFSPELSELAERVLAEDHLDSLPRPGKDTGAFCFGVVPDKTPWVLVNYNNRAADVATLAHELGHAIHAMMAKDHSVLTFHSSLPLAETASNFSEILLIRLLLSEEGDPAVRRYLLAKFIDDSYVSIIRQAYFVLFEREVHSLVNGEGATTDRLAELYMENLREQFADSVELSEEFKWEWTMIPHLYTTPFYCYAYAFGLLLVLSLYRAYEAEGESFVPRYLRVLSYGGSKAPIEILEEAKIDVRDPSFWQGGFDVIAAMIDEIAELV